MPTEEFIPGAGRELGQLIRALEPHGGSFTITSWASVPGALTVKLHLPDDEYREKVCRRIIERWRQGALPES